MAARKEDRKGDTLTTIFAAVIVLAVLAYCSQDTPSSVGDARRSGVDAQSKIVRVVEVNGIQFKIDAHEGEMNVEGDDALALLVGMVRRRGYRCDTVNAARPFLFVGQGFVLDCNGFHYRYSIEDRGGNWTVTLD